MKTILEIPDRIFRRAKSLAAQRGIPLRAFVTEAVDEMFTGLYPGAILLEEDEGLKQKPRYRSSSSTRER